MAAESELWKSLGLAVNEAKIYKTLLEAGESTVTQIGQKSKIHRRNAYDSLKRLLEKGLVFEILKDRDRVYKAVDPHKLEDILEEKKHTLSALMPQLLSLHEGQEESKEVFIYRGIEAYKNEMRDVLRIGKDMYTIGGKGLWTDSRLGPFLEEFTAAALKKKIQFNVLWDYEVGTRHKTLSQKLPTKSKILPKRFSSPSVIDIFGDHIVLFSKGNVTALDEDVMLTVLVNRRIADAMRIWFKLIWELI